MVGMGGKRHWAGITQATEQGETGERKIDVGRQVYIGFFSFWLEKAKNAGCWRGTAGGSQERLPGAKDSCHLGHGPLQ